MSHGCGGSSSLELHGTEASMSLTESTVQFRPIAGSLLARLPPPLCRELGQLPRRQSFLQPLTIRETSHGAWGPAPVQVPARSCFLWL